MPTFYTPCPIFWKWIPKSICLHLNCKGHLHFTFPLYNPNPHPHTWAFITKQQGPVSRCSPCSKLWQEQTSPHHQPCSTSESPLTKLHGLGLLWIWKNDKLQGSLGWNESSGLWRTDKNAYQLEPDKYSGYLATFSGIHINNVQ